MTTPILRTSERRAFKTCPQKWWWSYREGLRPKGSPQTPLWFGTGIHLALACWYCGPGKKRGPHPAETWTAYAKEELAYIKTVTKFEEEVEEYVQAEELGRILMEEYVKRYGRDEQKLIISPEQTFSLDVPWPEVARRQIYPGGDGILVAYKGTFDNVWRDADTGWLILDEHKTARSISTSHLPMDDQGGGYWAVATATLRKQGLIKPKEVLRGIEYNFIRKGLPDDRPRDAEGYATNKPIKEHYLAAMPDAPAKMKVSELEALARSRGIVVLGERSKIQPKPLFERHMIHRTSKERAIQLRRVQDEAVHMKAVKEGLLPVLVNPSRDTCPRCDFETMCRLKQAGGDWQEIKRSQYYVEDPYKDHRKSTDE